MNFDRNHRIHTERVTSDYSKMGMIQAIYEDAFPENERIHFEVFVGIADEGLFDLFSIVDGEIPVGLITSVPIDEKYVYILYLATDSQYRGMGYGSKTLDYLRENDCKDKVLLACIEALNPDAENYDERKARARFYEKNGFYIYDNVMAFDGDGVQIICSNPDEDWDELKTIIDALEKEFDSYLETKENESNI